MALKIGGSSSGTFVDAKFIGDITEALIYAANNGASVANLSLGGSRPQQSLQDAVNYATSKRVVVVASAGNSQQSQPGTPNYPAAYSNVIAVGATDRTDRIGDFSTNGSFVDVSAPGVDVLSTTDVNDPEVQTFEQNPPQAAISVKSGTSMAAPIVAGLAGLMRSVRPDLTPAEVDLLLKRSSRDLGAAGHDPIYGAGRVDAGAAVAAARAYQRPRPATPPPPPPPPPDRTGPTLAKPSGYKMTRKQLRFKVRCAAGEATCRYQVTANGKQIGGKRKSAKLGRKSFSLRGGQSRTVKIKLSKKTRRAVRRWKRAKVTLSVRATDAAGNVSRRKFKANVKL
jgi:subtilisin family serine protease